MLDKVCGCSCRTEQVLKAEALKNMAPERSQERIPLSDQRRILSADIREILAGRTVIYDDREPLNDYDGKIGLGSELAVSFSQIREHRRPTEFKKQ